MENFSKKLAARDFGNNIFKKPSRVMTSCHCYSVILDFSFDNAPHSLTFSYSHLRITAYMIHSIKLCSDIRPMYTDHCDGHIIVFDLSVSLTDGSKRTKSSY